MQQYSHKKGVKSMKAGVRLIKKGTEPERKKISMSTIEPNLKNNKTEKDTQTRFAVILNTFRRVHGFPEMVREVCLQCSSKLDVMTKAQSYWNNLGDKERSVSSVEAVSYKGKFTPNTSTTFYWNSMVGYNERALTKEELSFMNR